MEKRRDFLFVVIVCHVQVVLQCVQSKGNGAHCPLKITKGGTKTMFYSVVGTAVLFMISGTLIYRLGISDGVSLKKNGSLFPKKKDEKASEGDWQNIMGYDHKKQI